MTARWVKKQEKRLCFTFHYKECFCPHSLEVSAGYTWGLGDNEASIEITAGFSSTWSTEETWERTQSMEMSEVHFLICPSLWCWVWEGRMAGEGLQMVQEQQCLNQL